MLTSKPDAPARPLASRYGRVETVAHTAKADKIAEMRSLSLQVSAWSAVSVFENGDGLVTLRRARDDRQGSKLWFKAPAGTKPAGTQLFKATIANWNGSLVRLLNGHSHEEDVAPTGTYSNQVVGQ